MPEHFGYGWHPQKGLPTNLPCFALRSIIDKPQRGQAGTFPSARPLALLPSPGIGESKA